ncbi:hypothetical protein [Paenibacillus luteus]|uniref:hypothetical protein n=1 Tax=Paenibacillus luteus TaxID=2545753 RepID=UPI001141C061|nr:hypothetical protein [Paenibacillus luteus]
MELKNGSFQDIHKRCSRKVVAVGKRSALGASRAALTKPRCHPGIRALLLSLSLLLLILPLLLTACSAAPAGMHAEADRNGSATSAIQALSVADTEQPFEASADVVAWINSEPITIGEWMPRMLELRSVVAAEWAPSSGDVSSDSFWYEARNGHTPIEALRKLALDRLAEIKVQQMAARNAGIIEDISYQAFLAGMEKENSQRKSRLAQGQTIYGPKQYSEKVYYTYTLANMVIELKAHLVDAGDAAGAAFGQPLAHASYESWLTEQLRAADVQINTPVYSRLKLSGLQ